MYAYSLADAYYVAHSYSDLYFYKWYHHLQKMASTMCDAVGRLKAFVCFPYQPVLAGHPTFFLIAIS